MLPIGLTVAHWSLLPIGLTHCSWFLLKVEICSAHTIHLEISEVRFYRVDRWSMTTPLIWKCPSVNKRQSSLKKESHIEQLPSIYQKNDLEFGQKTIIYYNYMRKMRSCKAPIVAFVKSSRNGGRNRFAIRKYYTEFLKGTQYNLYFLLGKQKSVIQIGIDICS